MIKEVTMYYVECDRCHAKSGDDQDYSCWNDGQTALEMADDWNEIDGKHYCSAYWYCDDEDNEVVRPNIEAK